MSSFTVYDLLAQHLPRNGNATAVIDGQRQVTYEELIQQVNSLASWLVEHGVRRGDRVGIHLRKSVEEIVATFAIARVGAVFVNINAQWTLNQLVHVADDCDIRVLIVDERPATKLDEAGLLDRFRAVLVNGRKAFRNKMTPWPELAAPNPVDLEPPAENELAALLYTSGSTGKPKGVMLTHSNIIEGARCVTQYLHNTGRDRLLSLLPMSFDYGMSQVTTMFLVGGSIVLQAVALPDAIVQTMAQTHVTGLAAVPPTWIQLAEYLCKSPVEFRHLRYLTNSGGKIPDRVLDQLPQVFPSASIYLMYGTTEAFRSTFLPPELYDSKRGAIGRAVQNVEVFVVDPAKGMCTAGEPGELIHRGGMISRGYWGRPDETAEKIKPCVHLQHLIGNENVLHTGDLVREDEDGVLWFLGRMDDMIKCSGFRLSPTEVEDAISSSSLVEHVVAFGIADELLGQVVHVAVSGSQVSESRVLEFCKQNMPHYMVPRAVHLWRGEPPRLASGKLNRRKIIQAVCKTADNG